MYDCDNKMKPKKIPNIKKIREKKNREAKNAAIILQLKNDINKVSKQLNSIESENIKHLNLIGNFARHDIKNYLLNMDGILSVNDSFGVAEIEALKVSLDGIKTAIDNFNALIPTIKNDDISRFEISLLLNALKTLHRNKLVDKKISLKTLSHFDTSIYMYIPFQSIFQLTNNLILNAITHLDSLDIIEPKIIINMTIEKMNKAKYFCLYVGDNGLDISNELEKKLFEYGFSTSGNGSGIGLFHCKFICEKFKGFIKIDRTMNDVTKSFKVGLPIIELDDYHENSSNH